MTTAHEDNLARSKRQAAPSFSLHSLQQWSGNLLCRGLTFERDHKMIGWVEILSHWGFHSSNHYPFDGNMDYGGSQVPQYTLAFCWVAVMDITCLSKQLITSKIKNKKNGVQIRWFQLGMFFARRQQSSCYILLLWVKKFMEQLELIQARSITLMFEPWFII